jgi:hypothetical protein
VLDHDGVPLVFGSDEHANAPGMYFLGYTNAISGNLRDIALHAKKVARAIEVARKRAPAPLLESHA